jgi:hypothetical protein
MEDFAYNYAKDQNYNLDQKFKEKQKIHMQYLFDMMAGTSTGSILSTALSIKNDDGNAPKYWATDCRDIYINNASTIFQQHGFSTIFMIFCYILFIISFGALFFYIGKLKYDNPKKWKALQDTH